MIPYRLNPLGISVSEVMPLTLTASQAGSTVTLTATGSPQTSGLHYRLGKSGEWLPYTTGTTIPLANVGDSVQFWNSLTSLSGSGSSFVQFNLTGQIRGRGDCLSMLNWPNAIAYQGFRRLFYGCASLISAPDIGPAVLATACFYNMFTGCGFQKAPRINASSLVNSCCREMFKNCADLNRIEVDFTSWSGNEVTTDWVSGVAAAGTFIKPAALPEEYGVNRIPSGWTVVNK